MNVPMLYQLLRAEYVREEKFFLASEAADDEETDTMQDLVNELKQQHDPDLVQKAFEQLDGDIQLVEWILWFTTAGPAGQLIGHFLPRLVSVPQQNRVANLIDGLNECFEATTEPGDES